MEIRHWLERLSLVRYTAAFQTFDIIVADLAELTDAYLRDLGTEALVHRR